jgi:hypothetical protein
MTGPVLTASVRRLGKVSPLNSPKESEEIQNSRYEQFSFDIRTCSFPSTTGTRMSVYSLRISFKRCRRSCLLLRQIQNVFTDPVEVLDVDMWAVKKKCLRISGSLSRRQCASSGCGWRNGLQNGGYLRIYGISSSGQPTRGCPLAWGLGEVLTTPRHKNVPCCETFVR